MILNSLIKYFDLASQYREGGSHHGVAESKGVKQLHWLPQYIALVLGIIVQPFLHHYIESGDWDMTGLLKRVVASIFIGLVIFPAVYKNSFDTTKPLFVQLCAIFTAGIGWETLFNTATSAAS